jgi:hypothetical protein
VTGWTRRQALTGAALAVGTLPFPARAVAQTAAAGDAEVLTALLRAELVALAAYAAAARSADPEVSALARRFSAQEAQHVQTLIKAVEALSAPRPPVPQGAAGLDAAARELGLPAFSGLRGRAALLSAFVAVEELLVARWVQAHRDLHDSNLVQTATQVLGCQAQHLVVLRHALGRPELPHPVERGRQ